MEAHVSIGKFSPYKPSSDFTEHVRKNLVFPFLSGSCESSARQTLGSSKTVPELTSSFLKVSPSWLDVLKLQILCWEINMGQNLRIKEQMNEQKKERAGFCPCWYFRRSGRWLLEFWKFQAKFLLIRTCFLTFSYKKKKNKLQLHGARKILIQINGDITQLRTRKEVLFNCNKPIYFSYWAHGIWMSISRTSLFYWKS